MTLKNCIKFLSFVVIGIAAVQCFYSCEKAGSSGKQLYENNCANCHLSNGEGVGELIPSLINSELLLQENSNLACIIRNGIVATNHEEAVFEGYTMPPNQLLSDIEIANIINYARKEFTASSATTTITSIKNTVQQCN